MSDQRPIDTPTIRDVLAPILAERHISYYRLAERVGVDVSYISRIMSGQRTPSPDLTARIVAVLGLDATPERRLCEAAGHWWPAPPELTPLIDWYLAAEDGDRALVTALAARLEQAS